MKYGTEDKSTRDPLVRERSSRLGTLTQMKRLTIDIPAELHANVKSICARRGVKMSDAIRRILEEEFGRIE